MDSQYRFNSYEMPEMDCEGKLKVRSDNTSSCLMEVVNKAGLTVPVNNCTVLILGNIIIGCYASWPSPDGVMVSVLASSAVDCGFEP